jgi:N-acetylmuramoyl-L-alanine amidase
MYTISEQLIKYNRSNQSLYPQGWVIHSTATPGATAQNEHDYFNSGDRQASAHYFVDSTSIIRCIPEKEKAWHAGPTANAKFLSVEMCEVSPFTEVWARTVWLVADACVRYGWSTGPNVYSHRGISAMYKETDHTDPIAFLAKNGKTWEQLLSAIDLEIASIKTPKVITPVTINPVTSDKDIYLSVRCYESKAEQVIKDINKLGFAAKRMDLA